MNQEIMERYLTLVNDRIRQNAHEHDTEMLHRDLDEILCNLLTELGYHDVVSAYNSTDKWYA